MRPQYFCCCLLKGTRESKHPLNMWDGMCILHIGSLWWPILLKHVVQYDRSKNRKQWCVKTTENNIKEFCTLSTHRDAATHNCNLSHLCKRGQNVLRQFQVQHKTDLVLALQIMIINHAVWSGFGRKVVTYWNGDFNHGQDNTFLLPSLATWSLCLGLCDFFFCVLPFNK